MFYSRTTNGFYKREIHGDAMPGDVVEISDEKHAELLSSQSAGKMITSDETGYPVSVYPSLTIEQAIANAEVNKSQLRTRVDAEISWRQDAVDIGIATEEENAALSAWKTYRVRLMRVDTSSAPEIDWPEQPAILNLR